MGTIIPDMNRVAMANVVTNPTPMDLIRIATWVADIDVINATEVATKVCNTVESTMEVTNDTGLMQRISFVSPNPVGKQRVK